MGISAEHTHRLESIREYLDVKASISEPDFEAEVVETSASKLKDMYSASIPSDGECFISNVASNLNIAFEEIHSHNDIIQLRDKYLKQKELGFGQLELELQEPNVDALLFKRQHKHNHYVAVLNLQDTSCRAYWNKAHEVSHRLIEPPQRELFHRHRAGQKNRIEHVVDLVAAEIAYFKPLFKPIVDAYQNRPLTWEIINEIKQSFSPTSSLIAVVKAVIRNWSMPVFVIEAKLRGRKGNPSKDMALRTSVIDRNTAACNSGIFFYTNMRAPQSSPIYRSFITSNQEDGIETLSEWTTSNGRRMTSRNALTSAKHYGDGVLALISPI